MSSHEPVPLVVFTGFLGAGKTTVLQRIIPTMEEAIPDARILTIVNDMSKDNVDVFAFQEGGQREVRALSGGCVCCNLLGDLVEEVAAARDKGYTYIFLECTGVADPAPIVATLAALPALQGKIYVEAVVTVVSAAALAAAAGPAGDVEFAKSDAMGGGQVQGANVVLLNNWESLPDTMVEHVPRWVGGIKQFTASSNAHTRVFLTNRGFFAFMPLIYRQRLLEKDETLGYHLRAYAAMGKKVGDLGSAEEEAFELKKMGMCTLTFTCTDVISSTAKLRLALERSGEGRQLLRGVWRSKGFFLAVDDEVSGTESPRAEQAARQFRWQTVQRHVDYGEVLPPYVPLTDDKNGGAPLTCRIVFIGQFDEAQKWSQCNSFFTLLGA